MQIGFGYGSFKSGKLSRRAFSLGALSLSTLALSGCGFSAGGVKWRQKLTITAYTPTGEASGSSVTEHVLDPKARIEDYIRVKGEATVLDMGEGRQLFALLDQNHAYLVPRLFLGFTGTNEEKLPSNLKLEPLAEIGQSRSVPVELCPSMASFVAVKIPLSVQRVQAGAIGSMFGVGFGIKSIELELTNEAVTSGAVASIIPEETFTEWKKMLDDPKSNEKGSPYLKSHLSKLKPELFRRDVA
jgi:hypothetical protein